MEPDQRFGSAFRRVRIKGDLRQKDVADRADVSRSVISLLERGHLDEMSLGMIRRVCAQLDMHVHVVARWRGGDLDRLLGGRHSALHEIVARTLARHPGWTVAPEVSFSIWGERGVIDILAWHAESRTLLVIELKTEFADVNELVGNVDRKERLARKIGAGRGWEADRVAVWVAVADSRRNREHLAAHATMLRNAFPSDGRAIAGWLRHPNRSLRALGFVTVDGDRARKQSDGRVRVRLPRKAA